MSAPESAEADDDAYWKERYCTQRVRDNGRKIKDELENPFSVALLRANDPLLRPMARAGISANNLTFLSLVTGLLAVYCVWVRRPVLGGLLYALSYYFDCADGCMARFTRTESEFGDRFDHYKDILVFTLLLAALVLRYPPSPAWWAVFVSLLALSLVHFGSVERLNERFACGKEKGSRVLGAWKGVSRAFVPDRAGCGGLVRSMRYSRWVGDGSLVLAVTLYLVSRPFAQREAAAPLYE